MAIIRRGCPGVAGLNLRADEARPVLFLDRDGVINVDRGYVSKISDFEWVEGILDLINWAKNHDLLVIVVTNQSGVGRGYYSEEDFLVLTEWMLRHFSVDAVYYCPHDPDENCPARKPGTDMLKAADQDFHVDFGRSLLIGDKLTDLMAAEAMGMSSARFEGGNVYEFVMSVIPEGTF